jgi:hypothetical protein
MTEKPKNGEKEIESDTAGAEFPTTVPTLVFLQPNSICPSPDTMSIK